MTLACALLGALIGIFAPTRPAHAQPIVGPLTPPTEGNLQEGNPSQQPNIAVIEIETPATEFPGEGETSWVEAWSELPAEHSEGATESVSVAPAEWEATYRTYLPSIGNQPSPTALNLGNRASVLTYYNNFYRVATPAMGWTGSYASCNAGTTSAAYQEATRRRVVFYRAMAGVPTGITMYAPFVQQAQAAALMMSANGELSHTPSTSWRCYSDSGKQGAGAANLASAPGPMAIDLYMHEPGNNAAVGHRRWLLYPQLTRMGTGNTPDSGAAFGANALYVLDGASLWSARPAVRDGFVAWPPRGYVPYPVVPTKWSFSFPNADFSAASVTMWRNGSPLGTVKEAVVDGYGENTLVWRPQIGSDAWPRPIADTTFRVQINNVRIGDVNRNFTYTVVIFDPG